MHGTYIGQGRMLIKPVWGGHLIVSANDLSITPYLITSGIFEAPLTHFLIKTIKAGNIVFDIGANSGYYTTLLGILVGPTGKVIAYEPDPKMFELLCDNVGTNYLHAQAELKQKAVYSVHTDLTLHVSDKFPGHNSIYKRESAELKDFDSRFDQKVNEISVQADMLDDYIDMYPKIELIKMDIEGGEYQAFLGMKKLIEKNNVNIIVFEWSRQALGIYANSMATLLQEIADKTNKVFYVLSPNGDPVRTTVDMFKEVEFLHNVLLANPLD
ncbi:FkbM family methyltransferase [Bacillus massiliigorillae]|uniref:FkbM family methyltransferase n=1 Tax=Bacillus massiliigorillae TaxID=1243664 RepID=UPI000399D66F|nr:FkbM family methyltransferase [Bacillus massiliigorillae]